MREFECLFILFLLLTFNEKINSSKNIFILNKIQSKCVQKDKKKILNELKILFPKSRMLVMLNKKKAVVTWTSQAVPHLSTNHA